MGKTKNTLRKDVKKRYALKSFAWAFLLACIIFAPYVAAGKGCFLYYGDYNLQQIPFYQMIHNSIQSGNIGWSNTTDLGADIIGSYSFYLIGSPFFWITLLFPNEWVPYMMAPLMILKISFASLAAYTYLKRYVRNKEYAVFGGIIYAFSGFSVYNIFFNHFHEAMIVFPFLLAAVDEFMYTRRKGVVAVAVCASAIINYYFFAGQAIFVVLYWAVRMISKDWYMSFKEFLQLAFEAIIGFTASAIIFLPSLSALLGNSRLSLSFTLLNALICDSLEKYITVLNALVFPADTPTRSYLDIDLGLSSASFAAWIPLFSMVGIFAFFKLKKQNWLKYFLIILLLIIFVPVLNSVFQLFNSTFYARWYYMLVLIMTLATVISLDTEKADYRSGYIITAVITVAVMLIDLFMPHYKNNQWIFGFVSRYEHFFVLLAVSALCFVVFAILLMVKRKNEKLFIKYTALALSGVCLVYSMYYMGKGKLFNPYNDDYFLSSIINKGDDLELDDIHDVRSDFYDTIANVGMYWQIPSIRAYHSIVPNSITEFYNSVGVERVVSSVPGFDKYGLRSFLSCKYLFDNGGYFMTKPIFSMPDWTYLNKQNGFNVYVNECYIPYGFTYDDYITREQYDECDVDDRHLLLLKAIVLDDVQADKYSDILAKCDDISKEYSFTESEYENDCKNRNKLTCYETKFDNGGFTSKIKTDDKDELVFFSVPYTDGWRAEINGKPVEIEKVNIGFMAVRAPAETECEIRFNYRTPNIDNGFVVTGVSVVLFVAYMIFYKPKRKCE